MCARTRFIRPRHEHHTHPRCRGPLVPFAILVPFAPFAFFAIIARTLPVPRVRRAAAWALLTLAPYSVGCADETGRLGTEEEEVDGGGEDASDRGGATDTEDADAIEPTDVPDAAGDLEGADATPAEPAPPEERGAYPVGHLELRMDDLSTEPPGRSTIGVWYPAAAAEGEPTRIASLIESGSFDEAPLATDGPFPLVMFSHGNQGANFQSFTYYEHLASHGFVVAAPDHAGNRIADNPDDEETAAIALRRPADVMRAMVTVEADATLGPLVGGTARGISGHSFGGYTALALAGATTDVDAANARCDAGTDSDIFCPFTPYWPPGEVVEPPAGAEVFEACLAMAPGGYAAFGDDGVAAIDIPVFLMGGTDDEFTGTDIEPLWNALDEYRLWLTIERGGHMMFTDLCRLPGANVIEGLAELCDPTTHIDVDRGLEIVNTYATAFFRFTLKGDEAMVAYLAAEPIVAFDEATLRVDGERR